MKIFTIILSILMAGLSGYLFWITYKNIVEEDRVFIRNIFKHSLAYNLVNLPMDIFLGIIFSFGSFAFAIFVLLTSLF